MGPQLRPPRSVSSMHVAVEGANATETATCMDETDRGGIAAPKTRARIHVVYFSICVRMVLYDILMQYSRICSKIIEVH